MSLYSSVLPWLRLSQIGRLESFRYSSTCAASHHEQAYTIARLVDPCGNLRKTCNAVSICAKASGSIHHKTKQLARMVVMPSCDQSEATQVQQPTRMGRIECEVYELWLTWRCVLGPGMASTPGGRPSVELPTVCISKQSCNQETIFLHRLRARSCRCSDTGREYSCNVHDD